MAKRTLRQKFDDSVCPEPNSGCILWTACTDQDGYGLVHDETHKMRRAHRVAWEFVNGPIPDSLSVCHKCDTRACCNSDHMFLGDNVMNTADKMAKGRHRYLKGEQCPGAKLTEEDVKEIRRRVASGEKQKTIAVDFGINRRHVGRIYRHERWA